MKRVLLYVTQAIVLAAVLYVTRPSVVTVITSTVLMLAILFGASRVRKGKVIGTVDGKWRVRYVADKDDQLSCSFNLVSREILVDDEWERLQSDRHKEAILSHETGHAKDRAMAVMSIATRAMSAAGRAALLAFILRTGIWHAVSVLGFAIAAAFIGTLVVGVIFGTRVGNLYGATFNVNRTAIVLAAVMCGWQCLAAGALLGLSGFIALAINRDSEVVADTHARQTGYGRELAEVLVGLSKGAKAYPAWLSTHPSIPARVQTLVG